MNSTNCNTCNRSKPTLSCGICQSAICKSCTQFVEEGHFSFFSSPLPELQHTTYCETCYAEKVLPQLNQYDELMEKAKNTLVYEKTQGKETRLIKRIEKPVYVKDCPDRAETMLRLAFFAAQAGYNAIIDVDLVPTKIRTGSYQTTNWSGSGIPAQVNTGRLVKDRSIWQNPN